LVAFDKSFNIPKPFSEVPKLLIYKPFLVPFKKYPQTLVAESNGFPSIPTAKLIQKSPGLKPELLATRTKSTKPEPSQIPILRGIPGVSDGTYDGISDGAYDGISDGTNDGISDGTNDGTIEG
jgi:hypothetical protein